MNQNLPDIIIRGFFGLLAMGIVWVAFRAIQDAYRQYRWGAIYDLEKKEKAAKEANKRLSDDDLIKQANDGLGLKSCDKDSKG